MIQKLRAALSSGAATPKILAADAVAHANSNAGKNTYIALDAAGATKSAEELPTRFPDTSKPPLYGIPVSLKDCFDLKGFPTSCGSRFYAAQTGAADHNSAVATRLRKQGAIIIGKTHVHPLMYGITGENPDYGDCKQPRDATRLTGGSSSGAVASVQEGSAVAAIGTDTGGSIRVPSALGGLAGYRASIDLANEQGLWLGSVHLAESFDTLGWIFRDLEDGPLLGEALFGLPVENAPQKPPRIARVPDEFLRDCEPVVIEVFARWQDRLRKVGAEIEIFNTDYWENAAEIFAPIQAHEAAAIHIPRLGGDLSRVDSQIAERLAWGASLDLTEVKHRRRQHAEFRERVDALLSDFDYVMLPSAPVDRLTVGADHSQTRRRLLRYTVPMSLVGAPVATLPDPSGAGVQLAAARGQDARLLAFAAQLGSSPR
jgi:Asp-tRNA(Asn)/Glu-tRNA(Gln) amidotransferase A subunit family amidase